jgi:hypothetical protein
MGWYGGGGGGGGGMSIGGAVTSGTAGSVLFINPTATLAQDNTNFFWDDTNRYLKVGTSSTYGTYYLNGVPAISEIPNSLAHDWFLGNSGNTTVTGRGNIGLGDGVLAAIAGGEANVGIGTSYGTASPLHSTTSGNYNIAIGPDAMASVTTGSSNVAIGYGALTFDVSDSQNVAIGTAALGHFGLSGGTGSGNLAIGNSAANLLTGGTGNMVFGGNAMTSLTSGSGNTIIGGNSYQSVTSGDNNLSIGFYAGSNLTGSCTGNTLLGAWRGPSSTMNYVVGFSNGDYQSVLLDHNFVTARVWSFNKSFTYNTPAGLHVYNVEDAQPPTNYERAILDWNTTANIFRIGSQAGGTGTVRLIAIDGFQKAGAPAAGDLPSGTCALINDTSGGQTWLCYNAAGTIRKVQLT